MVANLFRHGIHFELMSQMDKLSCDALYSRETPFIDFGAVFKSAQASGSTGISGALEWASAVDESPYSPQTE